MPKRFVLRRNLDAHEAVVFNNSFISEFLLGGGLFRLQSLGPKPAHWRHCHAAVRHGFTFAGLVLGLSRQIKTTSEHSTKATPAASD